MKKVKKLKDNKYLSTECIVHENKKLNTILDKVVIVETITNENGTAIKFSDGTMICLLDITTDVRIHQKYGTLYQNTYTWQFPIAFIFTPVVSVGMFKWGANSSWGYDHNVDATKAVLGVIDVAERAMGATHIQATAIGKWK